MVAHACNSRTWEVEAGESLFEAKLGYFVKKKEEKLRVLGWYGHSRRKAQRVVEVGRRQSEAERGDVDSLRATERGGLPEPSLTTLCPNLPFSEFPVTATGPQWGHNSSSGWPSYHPALQNPQS